MYTARLVPHEVMNELKTSTAKTMTNKTLIFF